MDVAAADTTGSDANPHLTCGGLRDISFNGGKLARLREKECFHDSEHTTPSRP